MNKNDNLIIERILSYTTEPIHLKFLAPSLLLDYLSVSIAVTVGLTALFSSDIQIERMDNIKFFFAAFVFFLGK